MSEAALGGVLWPALRRTTRQLEILAIRSLIWPTVLKPVRSNCLTP